MPGEQPKKDDALQGQAEAARGGGDVNFDVKWGGNQVTANLDRLQVIIALALGGLVALLAFGAKIEISMTVDDDDLIEVVPALIAYASGLAFVVLAMIYLVIRFYAHRFPSEDSKLSAQKPPLSPGPMGGVGRWWRRLWGGKVDRIENVRAQGKKAYEEGRIAESEEAFKAILEMQPADLDAITRLGHIRKLKGDFDQAEKAYRKVNLLAGSDKEAEAVALANLADVAHRRGDLADAERYVRQSLTICKILDLKEQQAAGTRLLGHIHMTRGDLDQAEACYREALAIDQSLGRKEGMASDYGNLANVHQTRGDLDNAEEFYKKSLAIEKSLGSKEGMATAYGNLGVLYAHCGDMEQAEASYKQALSIFEALGGKEGMAIQYSNLGNVYAQRGELDQAEDSYTKALAISKLLGRKQGMAIQYGNLGNIYKSCSELDKAEDSYKAALAIFKELDGKEGMAIQYGNLGILAGDREDVKLAREYWTKSLDLFKQIGAKPMIEKVQGWLEGLPPEA